jgi:hypothetical protein
MRIRPLTVFYAACVLLAAPGRPAHACGVAEQQPFEIDLAEAAIDAVPPSAIGDVSVSIRRGHVHGAGCSGDSCDDIGGVTFAFEPPSDDRTQAADFGYRARLVEGSPPTGHWALFFETAVLSDYYYNDPSRAPMARLYLSWPDGRSNGQEALQFAVELIPLDQAGNEGPPTLVRVADPFRVGGCNTAGAGRWAGLDFVMLVIVGVAFARGRRLGRA